MSHEATGFAFFVVVLLASVVVVAATRPQGSSGTFCKAYGIIYDPADILETERATLLVNQGRRDPCGDDDLWHYDLDDDIDGVLFDDCLISWVGGGRSPASIVGIACEPREQVLTGTAS